MTIRIQFDLKCDDGNDCRCQTEYAEFEVDNYLEAAIDDWLCDYNAESQYEWEIEDRIVDCYDDDYGDPDDFNDLDEYGEHVEKCEEHGEAYQLRYADIGDHYFEDSYEGCWSSEEEFVQNLYDGTGDIPDNLWGYIDWESLARDVLMDYSCYEGVEGTHIFRD
jgi:antirestriction protein